LVVEDPAFSMEVVHAPSAFVEELIMAVIEGSSPVHPVVLPVAVIVTFIFVVEEALPVPFAMPDLTHILSAHLVLYDSLLKLALYRLDGVVLLADLSDGRVVAVRGWAVRRSVRGKQVETGGSLLD
jgi:hypothetical protein